MHVLVLGASGFLGGALLPRLLHDSRVGHVTAVTHQKPLAVNGANPKLNSVALEDFLGQEVAAGIQSFDRVVCLCGRFYSHTSDEAIIKESNLDIPIAVIDRCRAVGTGHFILASTANVRLLSDTFQRGYPFYKKTVEEHLAASGLPYTIFRPALIFGAGDAGMSRLVRHIRKYRFLPVFGDGQKLEQPIHVEEAAAFFHEALFKPAQHSIFEIGGLEAMTYNEMLIKIAAALGRRISLPHLPIRLLSVALSYLERRGLGLPMLHSEQLLHIDTHLDIDNSPALSLYDVTLRPFDALLPAYIESITRNTAQ